MRELRPYAPHPRRRVVRGGLMRREVLLAHFKRSEFVQYRVFVCADGGEQFARADAASERRKQRQALLRVPCAQIVFNGGAGGVVVAELDDRPRRQAGSALRDGGAVDADLFSEDTGG